MSRIPIDFDDTRLLNNLRERQVDDDADANVDDEPERDPDENDWRGDMERDEGR